MTSCGESGSDPEEPVALDNPTIKHGLPHISVDLEDPDAGPDLDPNNKSTKFSAYMKIDGGDIYDSWEGPINISGRGNSTWRMPKKPYKIYLDEATSLFGLDPYKKWIMLNEYLNGSMLYNSIPFTAGKMLGIPYTNTIIPVELTINGEYRGIYVFTEHKEVGSGRIDIGDDGLLLEMDVYFDEDWQFHSEYYNLPVMIQYPKSKNMDAQKLETIKGDFEKFEALVKNESFPNNNYLDYFDAQSFVDYMIVYMLTDNKEINHPKSTYLNKPSGSDKYHMCIIWDFDWAFGYETNKTHFDTSTAENPLFRANGGAGTEFFSIFFDDPYIKNLFKQRWNSFKQKSYANLLDYVISYAENISLGYEADHEIWGLRTSSGDLAQDVANVIDWLDSRIEHIDAYTRDWD